MNKEDTIQAKVEELRTFLSMSEELLLNELNDYIKELQQENKQLKEKIKKFDEWLMGERMMFYKGTDGERLIRYYETQCKWKEIMGDSNG